MFAHVMFACIVAVLPFRGLLRYRRLKREIEAGIPHTKVRFYRGSVLWQFGVVGVVLGYWLASGVPAALLGLVLPGQFGVTLGVTVVALLAIAASIRAFRTRGDSQLKLLLKSAGAILPLSAPERRWFAAVAVGAGISEELLTRGFLILYLWQFLPGRDVGWTVAASAAIFGYCHLYQGWRYMLATGLLGASLAWFYLVTGSLLGPVVLHIALDLRLIFIFTPTRLQALAGQNVKADPASP